MPKKSVTTIEERSTLRFKVPCFDLNGDPVVPTAFKWHLTTENGATVNGRENVAETPATIVIITLADDDLQILDDGKETEYRILTVETDEGDVNYPVRLSKRFSIENLIKTT